MTSSNDVGVFGEVANRSWAVVRRLLRRPNKIAFWLTIAAFASVVGTYLLWSHALPWEPTPKVVLVMLLADLALLLILGGFLGRYLVALWADHRQGKAGSKLHVRFAVLFSIVAIAPAIFVAVFSAIFFYLGIQSWFSDRVRTALGESLAVAEAYVAEHRGTIASDLLVIANDLNQEKEFLVNNPPLFNQVLSTVAVIRNLSEATVFDSSGRIIARTSLSLAAAFDSVPLDVLQASQGATPGRYVLVKTTSEDQVRGVIRLDRFDGEVFLHIARFVDPKVLGHVKQTAEVVREYESLEGTRFEFQLTTTLIFIVLALMLLVFAIWLGLSVATRLVTPITALAHAAEQVRTGDFDIRVDEAASEDEIGTLSVAFNRMAAQLGEQQSDLIDANRKLDRRRLFTEAVLTGVSSGVVGLDSEGRVNLPNPSASTLLATRSDEMIGKRFIDVVPEMAGLLEQARDNPYKEVEEQVTVARQGHRHIFLTRVASHTGPSSQRNFVVTFDDITELVSAQRKAAWAEVARRIAHEIKNPLTPIQLSAERLKRRYLKEISTDPDVFIKCTDTIIRQVDDIGRMVDEFSDFARMPSPVFQNENICALARDNIFPQQMAHNDIEYVSDLPDGPLMLRCDSRQVSQVFTNVLQNAFDAIVGRRERDTDAAPAGRIEISIEDGDEFVAIIVQDNGLGLPPDGRETLTEPYVTTRSKGTGLGLAIVKKIAEDHGGRIVLGDRSDGGAVVRVELSKGSTENEDRSIGAGRLAYRAKLST